MINSTKSTPMAHVIASKSAKNALAEQLAPPIVEERRFDDWLSRHAQ